MSVRFYFAYGSNMNPARVQKREMMFHSVQGGHLHHYELRFNKRSVKFPGTASANVVPSEGAVTQGVLYELTSPDQISMMDPYEGYPVRYNRLALPILVDSGAVDAWVYTANHDYIEEGLGVNHWYLSHLLAGEAYLTEEYVDWLREVETLPGTHVEPE